MKASRVLFLSFLSVLFVSGLTFGNADAIEFTHYYEENLTCTITTTTAQPVVITDGTDFDFQDGKDYLIIATATWGGADNARTYEINLKHNATIFEGSQQIIEPKASNLGCTSDHDHYKYFHWVIWSPVGATQASEDISINYVSNGGTDMLYDDVTIFVMELESPLIQNESWFYDFETTNEPLDDVGWNTNSSSTLSFTPENNNDDWLILGTALLAVDDIIDQFETRLNYGNSTTTPYISQEGEDIEDQYVQSFSRVFTLNNTQAHNFKIESRTDAISVGSNTRDFNAIFAMNLNKFASHNATYVEPDLLIADTGADFHTKILTMNIQNNVTSNWYIHSDFNKESDKKMEMRLQVDNVDSPAGQTTQNYDFSDGWDLDDRIRNGFGTFDNLDNSTHTVDVDTSGEGGNRNVNDRSMFAFTLDKGEIDNFESPATDNVNATDTVTSLVAFNSTVTDIVNATDTVGSIFGISQNATDIVTAIDIVTSIVDYIGNATDSVIVTDAVNQTSTVTQSVLENVNATDIVSSTIAIGENATSIVNATDTANGIVGFNGIVTDVVNATDSIAMSFGVTQNATDIVTAIDIVTGFGGFIGTNNGTDIVNATDTVDTIIDFNQGTIDIVNATDILSSEFDISQNTTDTVVTNDTATGNIDLIGNGTSSVNATDTATSTMEINGTVAELVNVDDSASAVISMFSFVDDLIQAFDGVGNAFNEDDPPPTIINQGGGTTIIQGGNQPVPTVPDSDGDGYLDPNDACPLDPEDFDNFEDADGCPEDNPTVLPPTDPFAIPDVVDIIPFEFNELVVVNEQIKLDTIQPQPQVEELKVRWLGDNVLTITEIRVGNSPFEIQFENIPQTVGSTNYGLTETQVIYTVQEPFTVCTNQFTDECIAPLQYDIPIEVRGEIDGKVVVSQGRISIDNSDRINPYALLLWSTFVIPIIALFFWKRKRDRRQKTTKDFLTIQKSNVLGSTTFTIAKKPQEVKKGTTASRLESKPAPRLNVQPKKKEVKKKKPAKETRSNIFGKRSKK